jgi:hypothetical protein
MMLFPAVCAAFATAVVLVLLRDERRSAAKA